MAGKEKASNEWVSDELWMKLEFLSLFKICRSLFDWIGPSATILCAKTFSLPLMNCRAWPQLYYLHIFNCAYSIERLLYNFNFSNHIAPQEISKLLNHLWNQMKVQLWNISKFNRRCLISHSTVKLKLHQSWSLLRNTMSHFLSLFMLQFFPSNKLYFNKSLLHLNSKSHREKPHHTALYRTEKLCLSNGKTLKLKARRSERKSDLGQLESEIQINNCLPVILYSIINNKWWRCWKIAAAGKCDR